VPHAPGVKPACCPGRHNWLRPRLFSLRRRRLPTAAGRPRWLHPQLPVQLGLADPIQPATAQLHAFSNITAFVIADLPGFVDINKLGLALQRPHLGFHLLLGLEFPLVANGHMFAKISYFQIQLAQANQRYLTARPKRLNKDPSHSNK